MEVAKQFGIKAVRAKEISAEVSGAVKRWRTVASEVGLSRDEQGKMERAFRIADATL